MHMTAHNWADGVRKDLADKNKRQNMFFDTISPVKSEDNTPEQPKLK